MVDCSRFTEPTPFRLVDVVGGGHDPIVWNEGRDFAEAIEQLIDSSVTESYETKENQTDGSPHSTTVMNLLQDILSIENTGVFCVATTNKRIQQWCNKLTSQKWFAEKT
jgi:hypothetical protein